MTIDEAIKHARKKSVEQVKFGCWSCVEEHLQLADMFEDDEISYEDMIKAGGKNE